MTCVRVSENYHIVFPHLIFITLQKSKENNTKVNKSEKWKVKPEGEGRGEEIEKESWF